MAKRKRRNFTPEFKAEVVLEALRGESSQAELCRRHNLGEDQVSKWKQQFLENADSVFASTDKQSSEAAERIAHLEHLVGRLTVALDIQKKSLDLVELIPSEQRQIVEALRTDYSVRQICETLGFNKSTLYYQPKIDASEEVLRTEIEKLAAAYPTYGYRRITKLLLRMGYTVGYRRVARLMKSANLSVSVKRICQTTRSLREVSPWVNRLQTVEVSRCDHVWVGDITYVRLKGHFIYVAVVMDVFTRMIRAWHLSQHLTQSLTLKPLEEALHRSVPEIHHSDQGVQYLSNAYISTLKRHDIEISVARRGCPWENGYAERLIRTLKEEEVHLNAYEDIHEARSRIGHFITHVYNHKRPHSALGYLTPMEFQQKNLS